MESYIVRVYRRCHGEPDQIDGLVEEVGSEKQTTFHSIQGLVTAVSRLIGRDESGFTQANSPGRIQDEKTVPIE